MSGAGETTNRRTILGALIASPALNGCHPFEPTWTITYRLRVYVVANGDIHIGSSTFKMRISRYRPYLLRDYQTFRTHTWGEAVIIDCGLRGKLFGLLDDVCCISQATSFKPFNYLLLSQFLPVQQNSSEAFDSGEVFARYRELKGEHELRREDWPLFVRFTDLKNPQTVVVIKLANGMKFSKGTTSAWMSDAFGSDADVKRVTIEVVDDLFSTHQIATTLPWVKNLQGSGNGGSETDIRWPLSKNFMKTNFLLNGEQHPRSY